MLGEGPQNQTIPPRLGLEFCGGFCCLNSRLYLTLMHQNAQEASIFHSEGMVRGPLRWLSRCSVNDV